MSHGGTSGAGGDAGGNPNRRGVKTLYFVVVGGLVLCLSNLVDHNWGVAAIDFGVVLALAGLLIWMRKDGGAGRGTL